MSCPFRALAIMALHNSLSCCSFYLFYFYTGYPRIKEKKVRAPVSPEMYFRYPHCPRSCDKKTIRCWGEGSRSVSECQCLFISLFNNKFKIILIKLKLNSLLSKPCVQYRVVSLNQSWLSSKFDPQRVLHNCDRVPRLLHLRSQHVHKHPTQTMIFFYFNYFFPLKTKTSAKQFHFSFIHV